MEITLASIADIVNGKISGDGNQKIRGAASFEDAKGNEVTFASQSKFLKKIDETDAGAVIVPQNFQTPTKNIVQVDNPQIAFIKVLNLFYPAIKPDSGISQDAHIGKAF
ncbi:MAG: LpxD N-terminal domain-containing protein, partial [Desulfobacterales bacterium]